MATTLNEHIVTSYEDELTHLARLISEMGGMVEHAITNATTALLKLDHDLAREVRTADKAIDEMQRRIDDLAISMIARRQPMAADLRMIFTSIQVATDLERTGDMAKQLAKRTVQIEGLSLAPKFYNGVKHMTDLVARQLKSALDAYASRNSADAVQVCNRDDEVDALYTSLFRELLTYMMEDPRNITQCTHFLFCTKSLERIGDHATNIAEAAYYLDTGKHLSAENDELRRTQDAGIWAGPMTATILIVEDEADLAEMMRYNLEAEGFRVETAASGDEAAEHLRNTIPDLILLDWMLPGLSGIELCRRWRARPETARVPIIMLTARGEEEERVRGLATGADDYVVKPFSLPELQARINALLRRVDPQLVTTLLKAGDLELDRQSHRVRRSGREVHLGPTEYRLLEYLMRHPGRVYSREQLLDGVWGNDVYVDERTVDVHVGRLRKAINRGRNPDPIRTVRGAGYAFDERFAVT